MTKKRLMLVVVALLIVLAVKNAMSQRKSEWQGLSESEARAKLDSRLPSRIPDDKRAAISDKVVAKMRDRGVLSEDLDVDGEGGDTSAAMAADPGSEATDDPGADTIDLTTIDQRAAEPVDT